MEVCLKIRPFSAVNVFTDRAHIIRLPRRRLHEMTRPRATMPSCKKDCVFWRQWCTVMPELECYLEVKLFDVHHTARDVPPGFTTNRALGDGTPITASPVAETVQYSQGLSRWLAPADAKLSRTALRSCSRFGKRVLCLRYSGSYQSSMFIWSDTL